MFQVILKMIKGFTQMRAQHKLAYQQLLAKKSVGFRTKVVEVKEEGHPLKDYVQLCILTRLRINGKIVYRKVRTLLKDGTVLHSGDRVHIRYNPFHLNSVLLGGFSKN
jgi:hypothetical protein